MNFISKAAFISCLFFTFFTKGDILKDDIYILESNSYSIKDVCRLMLKKDYPFSSKKSISSLDCMGTVVRAIDFCARQEAANPYLVRAIVKEKVQCISSKKITLKYLCKKKDPICKSTKKACSSLKEKLAYRLMLGKHSSKINPQGQKEVLCHFVPQKVKSL